MIEVHDMNETDEYFVGTCTHTHESEETDFSASSRLAWLKTMETKGSRVKVAMLGGEHAGFLHVIPIEVSPWGPLGCDLLVLPCLVSVKKGCGVGKALLTAAEEEARRQGRKAIVTIGYRHDFWYMPASFFDANGFTECGEARRKPRHPDDTAVLLWRVIDKRAEAPLPLQPDYRFKPMPGKVVIDLFWNTFCQTSAIEAQRVREVAVEFEDAVTLNEYCVDDHAVLVRYQISRGIFVNGRELSWGYEAPKDGLRDAISHALRK